MLREVFAHPGVTTDIALDEFPIHKTIVGRDRKSGRPGDTRSLMPANIEHRLAELYGEEIQGLDDAFADKVESWRRSG